MEYQLNAAEFAAVTKLSAQERYEYAIERFVDGKEIWSLRGTDGFVLATDDVGGEFAPIWPHPRFAAACAIDAWSGSTPEAIPLDKWLERWTPGLTQDGRKVGVFPVPGGQHAVVTPEELAADIRALDEEENG